MSFYDNEASWSAPGRQSSWEQHPPPSRSGTSSAMSGQGEPNAFASQFEEIDRATDNLVRSGKWAPSAMQMGPGAMASPVVRRDSMPPVGRGFEHGGEQKFGSSSRHHSVSSDMEGGRPGSAGLQGYYAGQRFPGGRQSEAEQMLQAKRRMAAQRERELRNYHQEQQYNRTVSGVKSDRAMSPNTMTEEDRRDLIARQHRALYGDGSSMYNADGTPASRPSSQDARVSSAGRGPSPLAFDPFGVQAQSGASESAVQMPPRDRTNSTASPVSSQPTQQSFGLLNDVQHSSRTSNSSPGGSPPLGHGQKGSAAGIIPIGTRPAQQPSSATGGLNKRSTTPLTPSSLSHGFSSADSQQQQQNNTKDERSASAASNPPLADNKGVSGLGNWGNNSAAWGAGKNTLAVQPSVWG